MPFLGFTFGDGVLAPELAPNALARGGTEGYVEAGRAVAKPLESGRTGTGRDRAGSPETFSKTAAFKPLGQPS